MPDKPYSEMTPEEQACLRYVELPEPDLRAFVVAHAMRRGQAPPIGTHLGFALTISEAKIADPNHITREEVEALIPQTQKLWLSFTVERADVAAAIDIINSQRSFHHDKMTSFPTDPEFLSRLADFLKPRPE